MDQNKLGKLFSWAGVLVVLLIVILVNFILGLGIFRTRLDFTEDKLYTLSEGTVNILTDLDTKVSIRYYRTEDNDAIPEQVQIYIQRVEDVLNEYRKRSKGQVEVELLNPEPDSDEEVAALQDGINRNSINMVDSFYNGIVVQCLDEKVVLPALAPQQETLLEYELSRALAEVTRSSKPKIAIMTDEPINGGPAAGGNPMNPMGGGGGTPAWFFPQMLERDYEIETISVSTEDIPEDVDLLLVMHPKTITERSEYGIDQFVLRGGKLIAFLDPKFYFGQSAQPNPMMGGMGGMGGSEPSTFNKLLASWGLTFTDSKVLADIAYKTRLQNNSGGVVEEPRVLSLNADAFSEDVPATGSLQNMLMWEAGVFTGTPADGLTKTSLVHSSEKSQLVAPSQMFDDKDAEKIMSAFSAGGETYDLAVMVSGKFKTAFPDGAPAAAPVGGEEGEEGEEDEKKEDKAPLKEGSGENTVVLIGDVDMLHDQTYLRQMRNPFTGQPVQNITNTNPVLVQNLLEQMAGNENLIKIRSRTAAQRSFTKLREMDEESDKKFRDAAKKGQAEVDAAQKKLTELLQSKGDTISVHNLDPETQNALDQTRETFAAAKKKLRKINLDRRKDKEALLNRVKAANILIMPALVILLGIALAFFRKARTAAK